MEMNELIDFSALSEARLHQEPFPYCIIPNFIHAARLPSLVDSFPEIAHRGSIPAGSVQQSPLFKQLITELEGPKLRDTIAEKFSLGLQNKPVMTTLRAATSEKDGRIHTDSKAKLITVLLFLNRDWQAAGGRLRLLRNPDSLEDYVAEIPPEAGHCLIFKVTPNGWHGHKPFVGKRLSLQLNYLRSEADLAKHLNHHRFTAFLKKWFPKLFQRDEY